MYSFLCIAAPGFRANQGEGAEKKEKNASEAGEMNRSRYSPREKAENERRRGGKGERGPHKYYRVAATPRKVPRGRHGKRRSNARRRAHREQTIPKGRNRRPVPGSILFAGGPAAPGRFRTINSVLWPAKSYDGNRVNHAGTRCRVRRPRAFVWKVRKRIPAAYTCPTWPCITLAVPRPVGTAINST